MVWIFQRRTARPHEWYNLNLMTYTLGYVSTYPDLTAFADRRRAETQCGRISIGNFPFFFVRRRGQVRADKKNGKFPIEKRPHWVSARLRSANAAKSG